jgi:hypothetical protein
MKSILSARTRFVRWQESSLRSFGGAVQVTLLTPDLPHMRTAIEYEDGSTEVDPFGCLEKAMATYALGVTHARYILGSDITDFQLSLMNNTDLTVVVICRPFGMRDDEIASSLRDQRRFSESVSRMGTKEKLCCIQCNTLVLGINPTFENIIFSTTYEEHDFRSAAELLFGYVRMRL